MCQGYNSENLKNSKLFKEIPKVKFLSLTKQNISELKQKKKDLKEESSILLNNFILKFVLFFYLNIFIYALVLVLYIKLLLNITNTQIHFIKDTLISFGFSLIYPLGLNLIQGIFRIPAINTND